MVCNEEGPLKVQDCIEYAKNQEAILCPESDDSCQEGPLTPCIPDTVEEHDEECADASEVHAQGQETPPAEPGSEASASGLNTPRAEHANYRERSPACGKKNAPRRACKLQRITGISKSGLIDQGSPSLEIPGASTLAKKTQHAAEATMSYRVGDGGRVEEVPVAVALAAIAETAAYESGLSQRRGKIAARRQTLQENSPGFLPVELPQAKAAAALESGSSKAPQQPARKAKSAKQPVQVAGASRPVAKSVGKPGGNENTSSDSQHPEHPVARVDEAMTDEERKHAEKKQRQRENVLEFKQVNKSTHDAFVQKEADQKSWEYFHRQDGGQKKAKADCSEGEGGIKSK